MSKMLLLLGPSGCGKTTIIHELRTLDARYAYPGPYVTRPLREGEKDKTFVTDAQMDALICVGQILVVNEIYGIRYATPKTPIVTALDSGLIPVLDWPVDKLHIFIEFLGRERLLVAYIAPPSIEELKRRLGNDERDKDGKRLAAGISEYKQYLAGQFDKEIDLKIVSEQDKIPDIAKHLHTLALA